MFPDWLAMPPLLSSLRLYTGPGDEPMRATANAYTMLAEKLRASAADTKRRLDDHGRNWRGSGADRAQYAFQKHILWMNNTAALIDAAAAKANTQAVIFKGAKHAMPDPGFLKDFEKVGFTLMTTNVMNLNAVAIFGWTAARLALQFQCAMVMTTYQAATTINTTMPPTTLAPDIASPLGTMAAGVSMLPTALAPAPAPGAGSPRGQVPPTTQGGDPLPPKGTQGPGSAPEAAPSVGSPTSRLDGTVSPDQTSYPGTDPSEFSSEVGFPGTSPYSSTLAALQAGEGTAGVGAIALTTGGLGAMSGAATGFRMPANWTAGSTTAFGATPVASQPQAIPATAPRGATAPSLQTRRGSDKETEGSTVFTRSEPKVAQLIAAGNIGVIAHEDDPIPMRD